MSGDIFKKAFSKSVEEERQRKLESEKDDRIRRERIEEIRENVESVISQIPTVFKVSVVSFHTDVTFWVNIPEDDSSPANLYVMIRPEVWSQKQEYFGSIIGYYGDQDGKVLAKTDPDLGREDICKWLASELGRILGEEYERHRDFYEKMEEGL